MHRNLNLDRPTHNTESEDENSGGHNELRVIFASDPMAVRQALISVLDGLRHLNLTAEDCATVELVLAEVMNNIVEHAYADQRTGRIELRISYGKAGLCCVLLDDGLAMPDGNPPMGRAHNLECPTEDLPEGGFGWFLIREMAKDLAYERAEGKNRLSFRLELAHPRRIS